MGGAEVFNTERFKAKGPDGQGNMSVVDFGAKETEEMRRGREELTRPMRRPSLKLNHLIPGSGYEIPETPLEELGHTLFGPLSEPHLIIDPAHEKIVVGDFREAELEEAKKKVDKAFRQLQRTIKKVKDPNNSKPNS